MDNVHVGQVTRCRISGFHGVTEIDSNHIARAPTRRQLGMPALATSALEHEFSHEELGLDRANPAEELFGITLVVMAEVLPGPTEVGGRGGLVRAERR